jgi:hypothetical protein
LPRIGKHLVDRGLFGCVERAAQVEQVEAPRGSEPLKDRGRRLGVGEQRPDAEERVPSSAIEPTRTFERGAQRLIRIIRIVVLPLDLGADGQRR